MSIFLSEDDVAELTGIRRGRDGKSRNQLQCQHLSENGIPFFPNSSGQPKVAKSFIEGGKPESSKKATWQPAILNR